MFYKFEELSLKMLKCCGKGLLVFLMLVEKYLKSKTIINEALLFNDMRQIDTL